MTDHFPMLVPEVISDDGNLEVTAPYDGSLIATVTAADSKAVNKALTNASDPVSYTHLTLPTICSV